MTEDAARYATLADLSAGLEQMGRFSPAYWDKMMHQVPDVPSVERDAWLLTRLEGKTVLHIGCNGPLHEALLEVCTRVYGVDQRLPGLDPGEAAGYPDFFQMDVETAPVPPLAGVEVVLLGEVLEHLVSPGALLHRVRAAYPGVEVVITVPNAFSVAGPQWLAKGIEHVNIDHCAWFSYRTLRTLVEKCGYTVQAWCWYGGKPLVAEGLLMVVR